MIGHKLGHLRGATEGELLVAALNVLSRTQSGRLLGSCEQLDFLMSRRQGGLGVEHGGQVIELLAKCGAPCLAYSHVRDGAPLVIPHGKVITVRDEVVGRLKPVGVATGLAKAGIRAFPIALHSTSTKGSPLSTS
jgi:hypothetical protein